MSKKTKSVLKTRKSFSVMQVMLFVLAFAAVGAVAVWQSLAAPHNGGGKPGGTSYTGTISGPVMVTDSNSDGLPNWGDHITFNVTSDAQNYFVKLDCYQSGVWVYEQTNGFYIGWAWGHDYGLGSINWKSGGADCTALLYAQTTTKKGTTTQNLAAPLNFHVND